jgi:hypothetical protein
MMIIIIIIILIIMKLCYRRQHVNYHDISCDELCNK